MNKKKPPVIVIEGVKYRRIRDLKGRPLLEAAHPNGLLHYAKPTKARLRALHKMIDALTTLTSWLES